MSSIIFKKYEENMGFEDYQAEIYNSVAKRYNAHQVTVEEIKKRLRDHKSNQDKNGIIFAFSNSNKPLAYIQYRKYEDENKIKIGFPWAIDGTPIEVQDRLFYDLVNYLKKKYPERSEFYLGYLSYVFTDIHKQILNRYKFSIESWFAYYTINLQYLAKLKVSSKLSLMESSSKDLDTLVNLCLSDQSVAGMGSEKIKEFFMKNIFSNDQSKQNFCTILMKNNHPLGTMTTMKSVIEGKEYNIGRMIALKKGEENLFESMLILIAIELTKKKWFKPILIPIDQTVEYQEDIVKKLGGSIVTKEIQYKLPVN